VECLTTRDFAGWNSAALFIRPIPRFVESFLAARKDGDKDVAVRDLYAYLLDKRYFERLNLLHFAFNIFDEDSSLPKDIIDRTPLPHEDGMPNFRHSLDLFCSSKDDGKFSRPLKAGLHP